MVKICRNQERNEKKLAIRSYNGILGKFEYDDTQFSIADAKYGSLIYIGEETDGSKIQIPNGVINLTNTFASSDITSPPKIPYGVKIMKSTFINTNIEEMPEIPNTVEIMDFAFAKTKIRDVKRLPNNLKSSENIFQDCLYMEIEKPKQEVKIPRKKMMYIGRNRLDQYVIPRRIAIRA